jgi:hypothetical protein
MTYEETLTAGKTMAKDMNEVAWTSPPFEWTWDAFKTIPERQDMENPTDEQLEIGAEVIAHCWKERNEENDD